MKYFPIAALALTILLTATLAEGSERSQVLSSRGLIDLHAERFTEALVLFDQAVESDPEDVTALYYRAATHARLKDFDRAIADLESAMSLRPDFPEAALDLGVACIETKQHEKALPWLEQARKAPALAPRAELFLGLAHLRLGRPEVARANFESAATGPAQYLAARYYQGVAAYQLGDIPAAKGYFAEVAAASPDSAMGHESGEFLERIARRSDRWYRVSASSGLQYDSNVILAPSTGSGGSENILAVSQQDDGVANFAFGAGVVPWRTDSLEVFVGYDFFQSLHFDLHEFDLQGHGAMGELSWGDDRLLVGLAGRYDYYLLDTESFLHEITASPWVSIFQGDFGRTELVYRMRGSTYEQAEYKVRDSFNHVAGVTQFLYFGVPEKFLSAGYRFDFEGPVVDDGLVAAGVFTEESVKSFGYVGNELNASLGWPLPGEVYGELGYVFRSERYADESRLYIPSGKRRIDDEHIVAVSLRRQLLQHIGVVAAYMADFNTSRDVRFDYDRHVVLLSLEVEI